MFIWSLGVGLVFFFFFFSSRRRHTRLQGDWSSDVCSSDLAARGLRQRRERCAYEPVASWIAICLPIQHWAEVREWHGDPEHQGVAERRGASGAAVRPVHTGGVRRQDKSAHTRLGRGVPVLTRGGAGPAVPSQAA